jgi:hypothetical protein
VVSFTSSLPIFHLPPKEVYNDNEIVKMKKLAALIVLLCLLLFFGVMNVGCDHGSAYVGMYIGVGFNEGAWLELKADGTFQGPYASGSWEIEGDQITFTTAYDRDERIIRDGKIMTETGEVLFVKQ